MATETMKLIYSQMKYANFITKEQLDYLVNNESKQKLKNYPILLSQSLNWSQMDSTQNLSTLEILKMIENARAFYIMLLYSQLSIEDLIDYSKGERDASVTSNTKIEYLDYIKFPDELIIGVQIQDYTKEKLVIEAIIYSCKKKKMMIKAVIEQTCIDFKTKKKAQFSNDMLQLLNKVDQHS
ncbi:hypothetical protein K502DRAFT_344578, partial [Neoconidiobolus thromboides FSU 785]